MAGRVSDSNANYEELTGDQSILNKCSPPNSSSGKFQKCINIDRGINFQM